MHSALLLLQHIQILMKIINFSISYGNFCMCTKHFASHCISGGSESVNNELEQTCGLNSFYYHVHVQMGP